MPVTVIEGEQRGDEGKGRFVDRLMPDYDIGARFNGGDNAGHTVVAPDGEVYKLHGLPTSIVHAGKISVIGNGTVINPVNLVAEITRLHTQGIEVSDCNLLISGGAHLILPHHIMQDAYREAGSQAQGSTKSGIAQVYADKAARVGVRAETIKNDPERLYEIVYGGIRRQRRLYSAPGDYRRLEKEDKLTARRYIDCAKKLGDFVTDTVLYLNRELRKPKPARVLAEGAQAFLLDVDHGMYPMVTSSSTTAGGAITGLGVPGRFIQRVIGVSKAVQSHVGKGPFVTEVRDRLLLASLHGDMNTVDAEKGTTTGRVRRLGYLDLPQICRSQMINGSSEMALTKLDWVPRFGQVVKICVAYERKGKPLQIAPDAAYKLEQSQPRYIALPTWEEDITAVRSFNKLPKAAQDYVAFIEAHTRIPITMIGVGPARDQVIVRQPET